jgi:hypothetical protein
LRSPFSISGRQLWQSSPSERFNKADSLSRFLEMARVFLATLNHFATYSELLFGELKRRTPGVESSAAKSFVKERHVPDERTNEGTQPHQLSPA